MTRRVENLEELAELARQVFEQTEPGQVIWLSGDLGAGKTAFTRFVCQAAGAEDGSSPTYALVQEYASPHGMLVHVDCYRLREPDEARDLDLEAQSRDARLTLIEWPERGGAFVPVPAVHLSFFHADDPDVRRVEVSA